MSNSEAEQEKRAVVSRPSERTEAPAPEPGPLGKLERKGTIWARFGQRLLDVIVRPSHFWRDVRREEITIKELVFPHLLILISLHSAAGFVGRLLRGLAVDRRARTVWAASSCGVAAVPYGDR